MRSRLTAALVALLLSHLMPLAHRSAQAQAVERFAGGSMAEVVRALREAPPTALKSVGSTSVVFRMELAGDIDAAFKPKTKRHPEGYRAEVAAFRIARALGMDNVAPVVPRDLSLEAVRTLIGPESAVRFAELSQELVVSPDQRVRGAAIYWVPELHEWGIDTPSGMGQWKRWLSQDSDHPPSRDKSRLVAAQVSTLILFDTLIGNWDRFSGANAQGDPSGRHLWVRDHNVAFFEPLPQAQHARLIVRLKEVGRFSRGFVEHLLALDETKLRECLQDGADPAGFEALSESQIAGVLDRRRTLLSYLAAMIDHHGAANVLTFP